MSRHRAIWLRPRRVAGRRQRSGPADAGYL